MNSKEGTSYLVHHGILEVPNIAQFPADQLIFWVYEQTRDVNYIEQRFTCTLVTTQWSSSPCKPCKIIIQFRRVENQTSWYV